MLNQVHIQPALKKKQYKKRYEQLTARLVVLQQMAKFAGLPVVALFEGWDTAGKGSRISDLVVNLDARLFEVISTEDPVGYESRLPFMARFWKRIQPHGNMTIFDQGWYDAVAHATADKLANKHLSDDAVSEVVSEAKKYITSIRSFEEQLADDGYLVVKFFLHISQEEQRARFSRLMLDQNISWRITSDDIRQVQNYNLYYQIFDTLLAETNSCNAPWTLIDASQERTANLEIMEALVGALETKLEEMGVDTHAPIEEAINSMTSNKQTADAAAFDPHAADALSSRHNLVEVPSLEDITHDLSIDDIVYKHELHEQQMRLNKNQHALYRLKIPMIIAYEGWDAAGKGGNIKRVASAMDARIYSVRPVAAPTSDELAHPFLWRFWRDLPRTGHTAIFDRTWYGRVLVERVEGFASKAEWMRAYDEINDFEAELNRWGAIVIKFWIDVSEDEQLRRFEERMNTAEKRWKITDEDWRNREKNPQYHVAVNDMLRLTSTKVAPWHIVESDDKHYARVKALRIINETIEAELFKRGAK